VLLFCESKNDDVLNKDLMCVSVCSVSSGFNVRACVVKAVTLNEKQEGEVEWQ
jgi:hypothetical protein